MFALADWSDWAFTYVQTELHSDSSKYEVPFNYKSPLFWDTTKWLDGRTAPRTAAMDTFRWGSGGGGGGGDVVRRMGTQQQPQNGFSDITKFI